MYIAKAYSAARATSPLAPTKIKRRDPNERDVQIEILFCGICHSDLHQVRNEWSTLMPTVYPIVPGHEIVGRVSGADLKENKDKVFPPQIDHVKSWRSGGKTNPENLLASCWRCNSGKKDYDIFEYEDDQKEEGEKRVNGQDQRG